MQTITTQKTFQTQRLLILVALTLGERGEMVCRGLDKLLIYITVMNSISFYHVVHKYWLSLNANA